MRLLPPLLRLREAGSLFEGIQRALDGKGAAFHHMGVDHGGADVFVAEQFLDCADVVAGLKQVRCEGMAQGVGRDVFGDFGFGGGAADGFLDAGGVEVVAKQAL